MILPSILRLFPLHHAYEDLSQIWSPISLKPLLSTNLYPVCSHCVKVHAYAKRWLNHTFSITSYLLPENRLDKVPQAETLLIYYFDYSHAKRSKHYRCRC